VTTGDAYVGAHLEEALAEDARVAEPGLHVEVRGDRVVVTGTVSDAARKEAVAAVLAERCEGREVVDLTEVAGAGEPPVERV
jgi:osmotically-inducible protein OsmY